MENQEIEEKITEEVKPLIFNNERYNERGDIECTIEHDEHGIIDITLSSGDSDTSKWFREVLERGSPAPYVVSDLEIKQIRLIEIKARLNKIDNESIRPLRAIASGTQSQFDTDKLTALETERGTLVAEMVALNG